MLKVSFTILKKRTTETRSNGVGDNRQRDLSRAYVNFPVVDSFKTYRRPLDSPSREPEGIVSDA